MLHMQLELTHLKLFTIKNQQCLYIKIQLHYNKRILFVIDNLIMCTSCQIKSKHTNRPVGPY